MPQIFFGSNFHKNNTTTLVSISIRIDFLINILFSCCLLGLIIKMVVTIYNNRSFLEIMRDFKTELKVPCYVLLHGLIKTEKEMIGI